MRISILVTLYNKAQYIERCLQSISSQDYTDFECVIIDDCSTDNSLEICENFITNYRGNITFRIIHFEKNRGVSVARNVGIEEAKGDYYYFMDSDDEITNDCVSSFIEVLGKYPASELVIGKMKSIPSKPYYNTDRYDSIDYIDSNLWIRQDFYGDYPRFPVFPVNKLINKQFVLSNSLYFKEGIVHEDELWMFWASKKLSKISFVHKDTYIRYYVPNSIVTSNTELGNIYCWGIILNEILRNFDNPLKELQFNRYLLQWMKRYEMLKQYSEFDNISHLFVKFCITNYHFLLAFVVYRYSNSLSSDVRYNYNNMLINYVNKKLKICFRDVMAFELRMLRVKLAIGSLLKNRNK